MVSQVTVRTFVTWVSKVTTIMLVTKAVINVHMFTCRACYFCLLLAKTEFSWQMLETLTSPPPHPNITFHANSSSRRQVVLQKWMATHEKAKRHWLCKHTHILQASNTVYISKQETVAFNIFMCTHAFLCLCVCVYISRLLAMFINNPFLASYSPFIRSAILPQAKSLFKICTAYYDGSKKNRSDDNTARLIMWKYVYQFLSYISININFMEYKSISEIHLFIIQNILNIAIFSHYFLQLLPSSSNLCRLESRHCTFPKQLSLWDLNLVSWFERKSVKVTYLMNDNKTNTVYRKLYTFLVTLSLAVNWYRVHNTTLQLH